MRRTSLDQGRGEPWNDTYDAGQEPRSTACMLAGGCLLYSVMRGRVRRRTGAIVLLIELGAPCIVGGAERSRVLREIQQLVEQGRLPEAEQHLAKARKEFPQDAAFCDLLGVVKAEEGDYGGAESNFLKAIELDPVLAGAYLNLGHLYQQNAAAHHDAPQKALAIYGKLLRIEPGNVEARYQSALLLERSSAFKASLDHLARLPAADQERAQALSVRCADLAGLGERQKASAAADELLHSPDLTDADIVSILPVLAASHQDELEQHLLEGAVKRRLAGFDLVDALGRLYERQDRLKEARTALENAAQLRPQSIDTLMELARIADKQNDRQGALGYLAHARDLEPRNAAVHFFFGMVSVEENLLEEAYKSLKQAVTLAPDNADYNYALGIVAQRRADPSEAVPFFKKYCVLRPDDARGRLQLGITYFYSHQEDLAEKELRAAIEHRETAAAAHFFLGRIANQEGKFSQALHELQQATTVEPNYADPYAEQGIIYMKQKAYAPAAQALLRALAIDPDHYAANLNLMMLYQRTGDTRAGEQARRFEEVKKKRAERARLSLRSIEIVR